MKNNKKNIPVIKKGTRYWIVRAGIEHMFYNQFFYDNCIAVGWDRIDNIEIIKNISEIDKLKDIVKIKYPELEKNRSKTSYNRKISDISKKIFRFINEIKEGDIIVTPGGDEVLIGQIVSKPYLVNCYNKETTDSDLIGSLNKARKVNWLKRIKKSDLEPNLRLILGVYHGIAHINSLQVITEINRSLYNFYISEDREHSIFRIIEEKEVDFKKYAYFINTTNNLYNILKTDNEKSNLSIKTNVQSPGPIELIGDLGLVSSIVLGLKFFLKNDEDALNNMDEKDRNSIQEYKKNNPPEYEYDDYQFPSHGSY